MLRDIRKFYTILADEKTINEIDNIIDSMKLVKSNPLNPCFEITKPLPPIVFFNIFISIYQYTIEKFLFPE